MFKNYLKIAWRNLLRNRRLTIINIIGLSFSVAFCLLLFFYIRFEQSYDTFHARKDRLFRFEMSNMWVNKDEKTSGFSLFSFFKKDDEQKNQLVFPLVVGPDLERQFPEIKSATRFTSHGSELIRVGKEIFREKEIVYSDDNFFSTFSFRAKNGNPKTALFSTKNVVISASAATRFFGKTDPIGKVISFVDDSTSLFTVAAVAEDAPSNSSIQFNIVVPVKALDDYDERISTGFNSSSHLLVAELAENVSPEKFKIKLDAWVKKYYLEPYQADNAKYFKDFDFTKFQWYMRPFAEAHYNVSAPWGHYTNGKNIYQLTCLVIIILLIASLNYVLLVISNAAARSQEVGVRKVMGAKRISIILQFWVETQIIVLISVLTGLILTFILLPLFNNLIGIDLHLSDFSWTGILPSILLLCFLLGLGAGYYPALVISGMKPLSIMKSFQTLKINPRFSRVLVVLQFTGCVVLMIAAFIINRQMKFINSKDLGFDKEQVLMVTNPTWDHKFTSLAHDRLQNFSVSQPSILTFSGMNGGLDGSYNSNGFKLDGEQQWRKELTVDYDYFEMLGIKFISGRPFSRDFPTDTSRKNKVSVVNESLFKLLGSTAKVGEYCEPINTTIIGVVEDYHFETLTKKIEPEEHVLARGYEMYFMFKIRAGQTAQGIAAIEKEWKTLTSFPFEYTFLDQTIAKMYEADQRWQKTIQASCFFAIFIACMGLFGLSAINAINRTREVGIRKVLGASVQDIVATLSSSFLKIIVVSILIATPIAWWVMSKWLEDFAYRIEISWWMFVLVGLLALLIAFATVSFQAIKAAVVNPVKSLRSE